MKKSLFDDSINLLLPFHSTIAKQSALSDQTIKAIRIITMIYTLKQQTNVDDIVVIVDSLKVAHLIQFLPSVSIR